MPPKIYTVNGPSSTSTSTLPTWLTTKTRPSKKHNIKRSKTQHSVGQLELIQDFAFPETAFKIKTTEDGLYAVGTGSYKPMMKVWDLEGLTVKFERVTDSENVDFVLLSSDWTKSLHLQRDRSLALHTQMGLHHTLRLPTYGRTLGYHPPSADALVGCTGTSIYRFNLEEGRYMTPLTISSSSDYSIEGVNVVDVNPRHGLWSFGLDGAGIIEFWDPRSRSSLTKLVLPRNDLLPIQTLDPDSPIAQIQQTLSVTALASHPTDGLSLAVGTSSGHTLLYDLRSSTPFAVKDQGYGEAMKSVEWLRGGGAQEDGGRVVSADSKVIKIWDKTDPSTNNLSLHPPSPLVDLQPVPASGLLFAACNTAQLSSYYIPEIGPAPKWAGFLDNVTEEMAEDVGGGKGAYSDFKFIDKTELETLGLTHLIGTPALKPYMHGHFLSLKLYTTARLIANPNSYAEHRERVLSDRLAAKAESRIRARKDQPKVNKALAERLRRAEEVEKRKSEGKSRSKSKGKGDVGAEAEEEEEENEGKSVGGVLLDPRFREVFENPEFEVDEASREFALLNPATVVNNNAKAKRQTAVEDEEDESEGSSSGIGDSEDEDEEDGSGDEDGSDDSDDGDLLQYDPRNPKGRSKATVAPTQTYQPQLRLPTTSRTSTSETFGSRLHTTSSRPSSSSASRTKSSIPTMEAGKDGVLAMKRSADGGMEVSFVPQKARRGERAQGREEDEQDEYSGGTRRVAREKKVEKFGAGLEKGGDGEEEGVGGYGEGGRTKRREVGRRASKNALRKK